MAIAESVKQLLEARKRVIFPGFGNLEVKESGGSLAPSAKRLDPPGLMIRFDASYSKDDGLLANAYSLAAGISMDEAGQQVLELVDAIRFALDKGESYSLGKTGVFIRDDEGKVHLQPDPSWVLEPDQYGLGTMDLLELEDLPFEEEEELTKPREPQESGEDTEPEIETGPLLELSEEEDEPSATEKPVAKLVTKQDPKPLNKRISKPQSPRQKEEALRPSRLWRVIWILAGILIVVLVVLLLIPGKDAGLIEQEQPAATVQPGQDAVQPELPLQEIPVTQPEDPLVDETDPAPLVEEEDQYVIIAGSFRNLANASELQDRLKAGGYQAEVMITENRMYRVSVASYSTSGEAERALASLKNKPGMESCWLLSNE